VGCIDFDLIEREVLVQPDMLYLFDFLFQMANQLCLFDIDSKGSATSNEEAQEGVRHLAMGRG